MTHDSGWAGERQGVWQAFKTKVRRQTAVTEREERTGADEPVKAAAQRDEGGCAAGQLVTKHRLGGGARAGSEARPAHVGAAGGRIYPEGGLTMYPNAGFDVRFSKNFGLSFHGGYHRAIGGTFEAYTAGVPSRQY